MAAAEVPSPVPPDDHDAWYAPTVHAQYSVGYGVVVTIREGVEAFSYEVREPSLSRPDQFDRVATYFEEASVEKTRPSSATIPAQRLDNPYR